MVQEIIQIIQLIYITLNIIYKLEYIIYDDLENHI